MTVLILHGIKTDGSSLTHEVSLDQLELFVSGYGKEHVLQEVTLENFDRVSLQKLGLTYHLFNSIDLTPLRESSIIRLTIMPRISSRPIKLSTMSGSSVSTR